MDKIREPASLYGVYVETSFTFPRWSAVKVEKLSYEENGGRHNIFIDAFDSSGNRIPGVMAEWKWRGQKPDELSPPAKLDKPESDEFMGDVPIFQGQNILVWIDDGKGTPSDQVGGFHTNLSPDPGHHSFYVRFVLLQSSDEEISYNDFDKTESLALYEFFIIPKNYKDKTTRYEPILAPSSEEALRMLRKRSDIWKDIMWDYSIVLYSIIDIRSLNYVYKSGKE